ncbi:MobV family relaxase [Herminiimonas contaminans]|uniref:Plasmid recombination protein n=1 Tax=Herminiimonas contaminans TaxID=1111140 RepID=A0ABS0ES85_9BURK|nr:MobV family relaxase [Herminiimonas contaminans]MBF8177619.1 plasmid recombination protein [Herminiimonas contaminans]
MGYAILRTQKLKSGHAVRRSLKHAFREQDTPNADPNRKHKNTHIGATNVAQALERFNSRLPAKVRSNAVLAIEYLITGSPDVMNGKSPEAQDAYFDDALKWLKAKHGEENVVYVGIHRDETTPHLYAYVVPLVEGSKLNCRAFLGGAKALNQMQTDFALKVGLAHGLQRGIEGSKARHTSIQHYYARANAAFEPLPVVKTVHQKLREEPVKPSLFASKEVRAFWQNDYDTWLREKAVAVKLTEQRREEMKAQRDVAVAMASQYQAQAKEAEALKVQVNELKVANNRYAARFTKQETTTRKLQAVAQLFTMEEVKVAQVRQYQKDAEKARQTELARQKAAVASMAKSFEAETTKRVLNIQQLLRGGSGAAHTFGMKAAAAMRVANGDASKVDWIEIEVRVAHEAIGQHGQTPENVIKVLLEHSPACSDPETHLRLSSAIWDIELESKAMYEQESDRSNDPKNAMP